MGPDKTAASATSPFKRLAPRSWHTRAWMLLSVLWLAGACDSICPVQPDLQCQGLGPYCACSQCRRSDGSCDDTCECPRGGTDADAGAADGG